MPVIAPSRELLQFCSRVTDALRRSAFSFPLLQLRVAYASKSRRQDAWDYHNATFVSLMKARTGSQSAFLRQVFGAVKYLDLMPRQGAGDRINQ
jgi:hypothetical protein